MSAGPANSMASAVLRVDASGFGSLWAFLGFYLAGNVLREVAVTRKLVAWSLAGMVLAVSGMALTTGLLFPASHPRPVPYPSVDMMFYDFLSPFRVLMAFCMWFLLAGAFARPARRAWVRRLLALAAPMTLGVYLVHPAIREVLYVNGWGFLKPNVWLGVPLTFLVVAVGSYAVTFVVQRIPGVRRIMG